MVAVQAFDIVILALIYGMICELAGGFSWTKLDISIDE